MNVEKLKILLRERAAELGLDVLGFCRANEAPEAASFQRWLTEGCHASMQWMERVPEKRIDPSVLLPGSRTAIVAGFNYYCGEAPGELWDDPLHGRFARYAWGPDYHGEMKQKLRELGQLLQQECGGAVKGRGYVDSAPLLEGSLARRAGISFTGRNTLSIAPSMGSYLFLGVLLVDLELPPDEVVPHRCGGCSRCIAACPTGAVRDDFLIDARRCISYLTIEHDGPIDERFHRSMGHWVYGCDDCQSCCPWNLRFAHLNEGNFLQFDAERFCPSLEQLLQLDEARFLSRYGGTAVERAGLGRLRRNAAIAVGNSGDSALVSLLNDQNWYA